MKKFVIVAIGPVSVHRITKNYPDRYLAENAARKLAAENRGIVFRVEEVRS